MLETALLDGLTLPLRSIEDFLAAGGPVLYAVFGAALVLWTLILERYWYFARQHAARCARMAQEWTGRADKRSWRARRIREALISQAHIAMAQTLPLIRMLISLCPLLGLLGTVTGMIEVFDVMALKGTADARAMAAGVSRATVPTMAGMVVGISGLFFSNHFQSRVKIESERLADTLAYR